MNEADFLISHGFSPEVSMKAYSVARKFGDDLQALYTKPGLTREERDLLLVEWRGAESRSLTEVLGKEGAQLFYDYLSTRAWRPVFTNFAEQCAAQGIPLEPAGDDKLALALGHLNLSFGLPRAGTIVSEEEYRKLTKNDSHALATARQLLTPAQFTLFQQTWAARYVRQ